MCEKDQERNKLARGTEAAGRALGDTAGRMMGGIGDGVSLQPPTPTNTATVRDQLTIRLQALHRQRAEIDQQTRNVEALLADLTPEVDRLLQATAFVGRLARVGIHL